MAEYIELTDLWSAPFDYIIDTCGSSVAQGFVDRVNEIKLADVRPVRRGRWVDEHIYKQTMSGKTYDGFTYCSNCKQDFQFGHRSKFCPHCGADMRDIENKEPIDKFEDWPDELKQTYRELLKKLYFIGGDAE